MICPRCGYEYEHLPQCPICRNPTPGAEPKAPDGEPPRARFCPHCGFRAEGPFCPQCGTPIPRVTPGMEPPAPQPPLGQIPPGMHPMTAQYQQSLRQQPQNPKLSGWMKALIVFCIVVECFSLVGSVMAYVQTLQDQLSSYSEYFPGEDWDFSEEYDPSFGMDGSFRDPSGEESSSIFPAGCSVEEYQKLTLGMTYAQASSIIGGDAQGEDPSLETEEDSFAAVWYGEENPFASVTIIFIDNRADSILQDGLLS